MSTIDDIGRQLLGIALGGACIFSTSCATAQITPDRTLPNNSNVTINGSTFNITGGTQAGRNLFHSFQQFSVPNGGTAIFQNATDIQNIFSRVTGGSISNIDGLIKANSGANLFLINPSGIVFGKNARLDIGGSFVASTASSLKFADGFEFSANAPQTTPLLTISVPIGLQYGENPGNILNQSQGVDNTTKTYTGLQVQTGKTLALVGGNVSLDGGYLFAPSGRVELGGLAGAGTVGLNVDGNNLNFNFPLGMQLADVRLVNATVFVSPVSFNAGQPLTPAGSIAINARNIDVLQGSSLNASARGNKGGEITLYATGAISLDGTEETIPNPNPIFLIADGTRGVIKIQGRSISLINAFLSTVDLGGYAGDISLQADNSVSIAKSDILSNIGYGQVAGEINIQGRSISITGSSQINAFGTAGISGTININASDAVSISGSGSSLTTFAVNNGRGGNINVKAGSLFLSDGARFDAGTYGNAPGGNINIKANSLLLSDGSRLNAGNIEVTSRSIRLDNRAILSADTKAAQGNIMLNSKDLVLSRGSNITTNATGTNVIGGNINIDTGVLAAGENSNIRANSTDFRGGQVKINAQGIFRSSDSSITATGANPQLNGTVQINTPDIDPVRGLVQLPTVVVYPPKLVASGCAAFDSGGGSFTIARRGGLPPSPTDPLTNDIVWTDARLPVVQQHSANKPKAKPHSKPKAEPIAIVPATGWMFNKEKGEVTLISNAPNNSGLSSNPATSSLQK